MKQNISLTDIKEELDLHKEWLNSNGKSGKQANFRRKNLTGLDLHDVDLTKADLRKTILYQCNLSNARLGGALLSEANVSHANLSGAVLSNANCSRTNFSNSNLNNVTARAANFRNANFYKSKLQNSFFNTSTCISSYFIEADLTKCDMRRAKLDRANFTKANLSHSDLRQANLALTDLTQANLTGAYIWEIQNAEWNITNTICHYIYADKDAKKRIPEDRDFDYNEFQEIYGNYPTVEYFFENGFTPIDPILLTRIIGIINMEHPETKFELESLFLTGKNPHAKFRLSSAEKAKEVLRTFIIKYEMLKEQIAKQNFITITMEVNKMDIQNFSITGNNHQVVIGENGKINNISHSKFVNKDQASTLLDFINKTEKKDSLEEKVLLTIQDELNNVVTGTTKEISISTFEYLKSLAIKSGSMLSSSLNDFFQT